MLGIITASAISFLADRERERVVAVFEVIGRIVFGVIRIVMWAAPLGAFGGMAYTVAVFGSASLANLGLLMVTFWATCAFFVFVILGLVARLSGFSIVRFIRMIRDELLIIVGTSSSETVLPRLLAKLEAAGASRQTVGMVIPTGYSFNLDGTCIYLTMGALFIVQATGQDMAIGEQLALAALMILTSKGAAGITGAGLVTLVASLQAFGGTFFTAESIAVGIALVVGIDRIMSEGRALTNCIGNGVATMVIAGWQGERDDERFQAALRDPEIVEEATERALRGEDVRRRTSASSGRFERERERRSCCRASAISAASARSRPGLVARVTPDATATRLRSSRAATRPPAAASISGALRGAVVRRDEVRGHHGRDLARGQRVRERRQRLGDVLGGRAAVQRRVEVGDHHVVGLHGLVPAGLEPCARRGARRSATAPCSGRRRRCSRPCPGTRSGCLTRCARARGRPGRPPRSPGRRSRPAARRDRAAARARARRGSPRRCRTAPSW